MPDSDDVQEARQRLSTVAVDLLVTVGLIASVIDRYPEEVRENFIEKIDELCERLAREIEEFTNFGEAFDESV